MNRINFTWRTDLLTCSSS